MRQTTDELAQHGAERWCWEVARRDDTRVARRLYRQQAGEGVDRLNEGAVLDGVFHFLDQIGVMAWLAEVHGAAMPREMVPYVQSVVLDGLKTRCGMDSMHALPALVCSDDARMPLVGCNAQHVRQGVCQRGAATRQGARTPGPISPETLANNLVKLHLRDLEGVGNGAIRALAQAGVFDKPVTGMADGTDLDPTPRSPGCGQVTRHVRREDQWGKRQAIEVTVYGWNGLLLSDAVTKMPWAVKGGQIQEHEALWARAVVTPARMHRAGAARLAKGVCATGVWDGTRLWWLDQQGIRVVVPANTHLAVTAEARAQAAAGEALTVGRRGHTVRHGQGRTAGPERVEPEVVGRTALTTDDQDGTLAHGYPANRRDVHANPIHVVVVRTWPGKDDGPGGNTVLLTNAPVEKPWRVVDDDDDRRLLEHCGIKAAQQPWELGHPPQQHERAVRVHVGFTVLLFALATASRLPCEREALGGAPVGWQRWRRQRLAQTRAKVIVCAQGSYGMFPRADYSRLLGVKLKDRPPGIGSPQAILVK